MMRNSVRVGIAAAAAAAAIGLTATTALADGSMYGRTCCDPGGASASGYATFTSRYHVDVTSVKLNDLCPGDGDSVYVELQYKQSSTGDWVTVGRRENHAGCSDPEPQSEDPFHWTATSGRIAAVRLKVCVDETWPNNDDCAYSNTRSNQYP